MDDDPDTVTFTVRAWPAEGVRLVRLAPWQQELCVSIINLAVQAYEQTGRRAVMEVVLDPEAALNFGIPPGEAAEVATPAGSVLLRSGRGR